MGTRFFNEESSSPPSSVLFSNFVDLQAAASMAAFTEAESNDIPFFNDGMGETTATIWGEVEEGPSSKGRVCLGREQDREWNEAVMASSLSLVTLI